jgi:hypothetical protein
MADDWLARGEHLVMVEMKRRVLCMFEQMGKETLDLHELFEAGGNDMDARKEVFYTVERLVEDGLLEERGNDFYALTAEGERAAQQFRDD